MTSDASKIVFQAIWQNDIDTIQKYLADPDIRGYMQQTDIPHQESATQAVEIAAQQANLALTKLLLRHFPDVDMGVVLAAAVRTMSGKLEVIEFLLDNYVISDKTKALKLTCQLIHKYKNNLKSLLRYFYILKLFYESGCAIHDFKPIQVGPNHKQEFQDQVSVINAFFSEKVQRLRLMSAKVYADAYKHQSQHQAVVNNQLIVLQASMIPSAVLADIQLFAHPTLVNVN